MHTAWTTGRSKTSSRSQPSSFGFLEGESLTTRPVTAAAREITQAQKTNIPSSPRTSSMADLE